MRLAPWLLLALSLPLPLLADERQVTVRVSPISDAVELVDRSGKAWRTEGRAAERLGAFHGRRVTVEGSFGADGQARLRRLVEPAQQEVEVVPRADSEQGPLQLELGDGRRFKAVGPAAQALWRALDRFVRARIHLFAAEREVWVEAVQATVSVDTWLLRSRRLLPGSGRPHRFPVNRVLAGAEVWVQGSAPDRRLVIDPPYGPAGEIEQEKLALSESEVIPRHATSVPAGSLRQQLDGMIPGDE